MKNLLVILVVIVSLMVVGCDLAPAAASLSETSKTLDGASMMLEATEAELRPLAYQIYNNFFNSHNPVCWGFRAAYSSCGDLVSLTKFARYDGFELYVPATEAEIEEFLADARGSGQDEDPEDFGWEDTYMDTYCDTAKYSDLDVAEYPDYPDSDPWEDGFYEDSVLVDRPPCDGVDF